LLKSFKWGECLDHILVFETCDDVPLKISFWLLDAIELIWKFLFDTVNDVLVELVNFTHLREPCQYNIFHWQYFVLLCLVWREIVDESKDLRNEFGIPLDSFRAIRYFIVGVSDLLDYLMHFYDIFDGWNQLLASRLEVFVCLKSLYCIVVIITVQEFINCNVEVTHVKIILFNFISFSPSIKAICPWFFIAVHKNSNCLSKLLDKFGLLFQNYIELFFVSLFQLFILSTKGDWDNFLLKLLLNSIEVEVSPT